MARLILFVDVGLVLVFVIPTALLAGRKILPKLRQDFAKITRKPKFAVLPPGGLPFNEHERPDWRVHDRRGYNERADLRCGKGPSLMDENTCLAIAHTQLASTEMQLRVESRCFEVAQAQLQVQAEKTATANAQLAVEKARRQIRQFDIELELKQAAAATAKSDRDAACDAARKIDLDRQMAISQLMQEGGGSAPARCIEREGGVGCEC